MLYAPRIIFKQIKLITSSEKLWLTKRSSALSFRVKGGKVRLRIHLACNPLCTISSPSSHGAVQKSNFPCCLCGRRQCAFLAGVVAWVGGKHSGCVWRAEGEESLSFLADASRKYGQRERASSKERRATQSAAAASQLCVIEDSKLRSNLIHVCMRQLNTHLSTAHSSFTRMLHHAILIFSLSERMGEGLFTLCGYFFCHKVKMPTWARVTKINFCCIHFCCTIRSQYIAKKNGSKCFSFVLSHNLGVSLRLNHKKMGVTSW